MILQSFEVEDILDRVIRVTPQLKPGDRHYRPGFRTYKFSSHNFIEKYRQWNEDAYQRLLARCSGSRAGQDRSAHGQIAACLGRYAKGRDDLRKIGRRELSRDVHGNMVRPMWWIYRERI